MLVSDKSVNIVVVDSSEYDLTDEYFHQHAGNHIQMILERCSRAVVLSIFTKSDQLCSTDDRSAKKRHYEQCLRDMLKERKAEIKKRGLQTSQSSYNSFHTHQQVDVKKEVLFFSSSTTEGMEELYEHLQENTDNETLWPVVSAEVPERWLSFEERLKYSAEVILGLHKQRNDRPYRGFSVLKHRSRVPMWSIETVQKYGTDCGLCQEDSHLVLLYLHQISSILYYPQYCLSVPMYLVLFHLLLMFSRQYFNMTITNYNVIFVLK